MKPGYVKFDAAFEKRLKKYTASTPYLISSRVDSGSYMKSPISVPA